MHPAAGDHLHLGCIPELVMGCGILELFGRTEVFPPVMAMLRNGFHGPLRKAFDPVIVQVIPAEVIRKLPPYNQFFQKGIAGCASSRRPGRLQCDPLGRQLAEMQPG